MKLSTRRSQQVHSENHKQELVRLVGCFMHAMHAHDAGRTLPLLHATKLTTPQLAVLEFVRTPRTVSAIADHVALSRPATSQMIQKLVQRRLIRRFDGSTDRRKKTIALSPTGAALLERISAARMARFGASLSVLPARVAAQLARALVEAVAVLDDFNPSASTVA